VELQRRKFSRGFKLKSVKLVRECGVSVSQAARDLDLHENVLRKHENVLRKWVREQQEIERLRCELARMKAERDILEKNGGLLRQGLDMKFEFVTKHREIWPVSWICEALSVSWQAALMPGWFAHPVPAPGATRRSAPRRAPASSPAIGRTTHAASGTTFWPKASHVVCTVSSG
jgi:transposase-like protein